MNVERLKVNTGGIIPLMAALPYGIAVSRPDEAPVRYDAETQLTIFASRNYSTCREDESVNPLFGRSKTDTKKDD